MNYDICRRSSGDSIWRVNVDIENEANLLIKLMEELTSFTYLHVSRRLIISPFIFVCLPDLKIDGNSLEAIQNKSLLKLIETVALFPPKRKLPFH